MRSARRGITAIMMALSTATAHAQGAAPKLSLEWDRESAQSLSLRCDPQGTPNPCAQACSRKDSCRIPSGRCEGCSGSASLVLKRLYEEGLQSRFSWLREIRIEDWWYRLSMAEYVWAHPRGLMNFYSSQEDPALKARFLFFCPPGSREAWVSVKLNPETRLPETPEFLTCFDNRGSFQVFEFFK